MKKIIKVLFASVVCIGITSVSALAYYSHSGWVFSPVYPLNVTKYSYEYNLTSAYNTVELQHAGALFTNGTLPAAMIQQPHDFPIYLVDSDYGNADDKLKRYEGMFDGGTLTEIQLQAVNYPLSEAIDSSGDNQAELYIEGTLSSKLSDQNVYDPYSGPGEDMFSFDIQVE